MIEKTIDFLIHVAAPTDKNSISSVRLWVILLMAAPMIMLTNLNSLLHIRTTLLLVQNIVIRLKFPSRYYPATASIKGFIASPIYARSIAYVAEFAMYELWAVWIGVDFWGSNKLWAIVLFGECISTLGVLLQAEFLLKLEDSTWAIHAIYMAYLSYPKNLWAMSFFFLFSLYLILYHLPRMIKAMLSRLHRDGKNVSEIFKMDPLFLRYYFINYLPRDMTKDDKSLHKVPIIRKISKEEKAWVLPMLIG